MRLLQCIISLVFCIPLLTYSGNTQLVIPVAGTSTAYSQSVSLADTETKGVSMIMKVNDTTAPGFKNDSVNVGWGYQLGYTITGKNGVDEVLWNDRDRISVDTAKASTGFGITDVGYSYQSTTIVGINGEIAVFAKAGATGKADTTKVNGYAIQRRTSYIDPAADYIRFYAVGITGNNVDTLDMVIEPRFF